MTLSPAAGVAAGVDAAAADKPPPAVVLTPLCAVPESDIATPAPLPNVMARLQKHATIHILAIGSSSTSGVGASSKLETYPSWLDTILEKTLKGVDIEIVNRGIPGELAETTADRIMNEVALSKPDLVLWQLGTNDALARVPPEEFEVTVRETLRWLKSQNIDVVLVGLQYVPRFSRDPAYSAIRQVLRKIAAEENILYVRRYEAMQFIEQMRAKEQIMAPDQFHLNDLGYRCMAEHVARAVIISLFSRAARPAND
ncbi:MAG: SGNH/GDSL hydrolase family protein [Methylovirgula sp.]